MAATPTPALNKALIAAQAKISNVAANSKNSHFGNTYADLGAVLEVVRPVLSENGIAVTQHTEIANGGGVVLVTTLLHESGEERSGYYPIEPAKRDPQGLGAALTYGRRYALAAMVGIAQADDDGESQRRKGDQQRPEKSERREQRQERRDERPREREQRPAKPANGEKPATGDKPDFIKGLRERRLRYADRFANWAHGVPYAQLGAAKREVLNTMFKVLPQSRTNDLFKGEPDSLEGDERIMAKLEHADLDVLEKHLVDAGQLAPRTERAAPSTTDAAAAPQGAAR